MKALCITGIVIAVLLILLFGVDLGIGVPLGGFSPKLEIGIIVAAVLLGYGSWHALREQT